MDWTEILSGGMHLWTLVLTMVVVLSLAEQGLLRICCSTFEAGSKASQNADLSAQRSAMELIMAILLSRRAIFRSRLSDAEASALGKISQNFSFLVLFSGAAGLASTGSCGKYSCCGKHPYICLDFTGASANSALRM